MIAGEFGGFELAIGAIYGARHWTVDSLGRLTGVTHRSIWTPGINVAECKVTGQSKKCAAGECGTASHKGYKPGVLNWPTPQMVWGASGHVTMRLDDGFCREPQPCDGVDPACSCGFWAYYEDAVYSDYDHEGFVRGVIKAFGKTTIGTKGFRCEKAEIVALHLPGKKRHRHTNALIRRNYPAVSFFNDYDAMLDSFPLESEVEPTPENDPEFWTRPADKPLPPPTHLWKQEGAQS